MYGLGILAGILITVLAFFFDQKLMEWLTATPGSWLHITANFISWAGRMDTIPVVLVFGGVISGWILRRRHLFDASITCFWVILCSGFIATIGKVLIGRPRPSTPMPDGFYGPSLRYAMQSFPSGHTAAACALGVAFAVISPRFAWLGISYGILVAWSRIALNVHHPSDVIAGLALGSFCGAVFGFAYRQRSESGINGPTKPSPTRRNPDPV